MNRIVRFFVCAAFAGVLSIGFAPAQLLVKGGPGICNVIGDDAPDDKSFFLGFYLGVARDFQLSKKVQFQPAMIYSLQGYHWGNSSVDRFHYLQMPLNFKFGIGKQGGIMVGPQFGVLTKASAEIAGSKFNITSAIKTLTVSFGAGPYVRAGDRVTLEARAVIDLSNFDRAGSYIQLFVVQAGVSVLINKPVESE